MHILPICLVDIIIFKKTSTLLFIIFTCQYICIYDGDDILITVSHMQGV